MTRARAAADAMARELGAIFPPAVAQDCANNLAQAALGDVSLYSALTQTLLRRREDFDPRPGADMSRVYARVATAWIDHTAAPDNGLHLFSMVLAHGFTRDVAELAISLWRAA